MKNLIYLCLFLNFSTISNAQVPDTAPWCPDGATWVYQKKAMSQAAFSVYEFVKDTTIANLPVKIIESKEIHVHFPNPVENFLGRYVSDSSVFYLHERNDSVFYFFNGEFRFMYDFNAEIGDVFISKSFNEYLPCDNSNPNYLENDTMSVFLKNTIPSYGGNNFTFDRLLMNTKGKWDYGDIIRNIGGATSFFPRPSKDSICTWANTHSGLECYSDNIRGFLSFYNLEDIPSSIDRCGYIVTKVDPIEMVKEDYYIYPNPTNDRISVKSSNPTFKSDFYIMDLTGRKIKSINDSDLQEIDISNLIVGNYFLVIQSNSTIPKTLKFIKL